MSSVNAMQPVKDYFVQSIVLLVNRNPVRSTIHVTDYSYSTPYAVPSAKKSNKSGTSFVVPGGVGSHMAACCPFPINA